MTNLPEWALPIRDEMAEEVDKWIGDMSTSPDIATAALTVALPLIVEHMAGVATSFLVGDPMNGVPFRNPMAHEIADAIRQEAKTKSAE